MLIFSLGIIVRVGRATRFSANDDALNVLILTMLPWVGASYRQLFLDISILDCFFPYILKV